MFVADWLAVQLAAFRAHSVLLPFTCLGRHMAYRGLIEVLDDEPPPAFTLGALGFATHPQTRVV